RFAPGRWRARLGAPLRLLLAAPYLLFALNPGLPVAVVAVVLASVGFSASLLLQERLMALTPTELSGQALGLSSSGMLAMQGVGAALAGSIAQEGSWGWIRDWSGRDRVDWRPRTYWKPGTEVTLDAELNGTDSGPDGGWFVRDYTTRFTIGDRQIVRVDLDRHQLSLVRDGKTVRRLPVSGGTPGGDRRSWRGTAVLMAKEGTINMNSETVGLGDAYDRMVDHSMRLTWSGMYAHAAPWNARYLGRANRSSGCIGMSDADAAWFYAQVRPGDPFEITGKDTKGVVEPGNGFGAWNLSWAEWQERSALR
ncbi:L,D-transpeptidase, partial [Streptomyces halstedii]|uniref:L,D-transpeptidase n=1 Tax=Streptomyces halstedii TaxID=1944 RepID=UPI0033BEBC88